MYRLNIHFENNTILTYNSLPYSIADIWIETFIIPSIKTQEKVRSNINSALTHFSFPTLDSRDELTSKLGENIDTLRNAGYPIPYDFTSGFSREVLNKLHEYFHTHVESKVNSEKDQTVIDHVLQLNHNIHKLEPYMNDFTEYTNDYSVVAIKGTESISSELPKDVKKLFTIENYNYGIELTQSKNLGYINYTTIGKHLYNCFHDNDIDIVKKGLIRNKTKGDNFIKFTYNQSRLNMETTSSSIHKEYIEKWLESHGIENKEEILTEDNLNQIYPPILEMTKECESRYSIQDFYNLYKHSKPVNITITKL